MCMSILSEHWAPKCSGTCLSIMLTLLSTKLWNDGELWLLKKLILYLWIQCQDSFIFQAATNGLDYNSPGSRVYHQGLWSESTSCRIWTNTGCFFKLPLPKWSSIDQLFGTWPFWWSASFKNTIYANSIQILKNFSSSYFASPMRAQCLQPAWCPHREHSCLWTFKRGYNWKTVLCVILDGK